MPRIIGDLLAGLLVGPTIWGTTITDTIFPASNRYAIRQMGYLGVLLASLIAGASFDRRILRGRYTSVIALGCANVIFPGLLAIPLYVALPPSAKGIVGGVMTTPGAAVTTFIACILAATTLPVVFLQIEDFHLSSNWARYIVSVDCVASLLLFTLLSIGSGLAVHDGGKALAMRLGIMFGVLLGLLAMQYVWISAIVKFGTNTWAGKPTTDFFLIIIGLAIVVSVISDVLGFSHVMGAFGVGLCLPFNEVVRSRLTQLVRWLCRWILLPMFFLDVGLDFNLRLIPPRYAGYVLLVMLWGLLSKLALVPFARFFLRLQWREAVFCCVLASARGFNGLIVSKAAYSTGLFDQLLFASGILICLATSIVAIPLAKVCAPMETARKDMELVRRQSATFDKPATEEPSKDNAATYADISLYKGGEVTPFNIGTANLLESFTCSWMGLYANERKLLSGRTIEPHLIGLQIQAFWAPRSRVQVEEAEKDRVAANGRVEDPIYNPRSVFQERKEDKPEYLRVLFPEDLLFEMLSTQETALPRLVVCEPLVPKEPVQKSPQELGSGAAGTEQAVGAGTTKPRPEATEADDEDSSPQAKAAIAYHLFPGSVLIDWLFHAKQFTVRGAVIEVVRGLVRKNYISYVSFQRDEVALSNPPLGANLDREDVVLMCALIYRRGREVEVAREVHNDQFTDVMAAHGLRNVLFPQDPAPDLPNLVSGSSELLSDDLLKKLVAAVPDQFQLQKWVLVYSIDRDGASLRKLYDACARASEDTGCHGTLIIIRDEEGKVFGGFASHSWQVEGSRKPQQGQKKGLGFYGSHACFVFQVADGRIRRYGSKGVNRFWQQSSEEMLTLGGGDNNAVRLDKSLRDGWSGPCETFGSPTLSTRDRFQCHRLELWAPAGASY